MYDIYISTFKDLNGNIVNDEELMFSIPNANGEFPIQKPIVKSSEDAADNFSFSMESNSPYYDALLPLKTMFRVVYDNTIIFYGKVFTVSKQTFFQTKNVTCVGTYTFLNDTYYEGKQEKNIAKITIEEYINKIIANHNSQVGEDKKIIKGTIQTNKLALPPLAKKDRYEPTSWSQSSSLLSGLTNNYGGHMRIRYVYSGGKTNSRLDWYKYYWRDAGANGGVRPSVEIKKNILDISAEDQVDNIFTRIIPIGSNNKPIYVKGYKYNGSTAYTEMYIPVSFIRGHGIYTDAQLNADEFHNASDYTNAEDDYGIIYKTVDFSDANTQKKLWEAAVKWIKECYFGLVTSFTVKAIDLHAVNRSDAMILLGERVDVTYMIKRGTTIRTETKELICKSVQYDLFNPENTSYTFSIPTDLLNFNRQHKSSKKQEASAAAATPLQSSGPSDHSWTFQSIANLILTEDKVVDGVRDAGSTELYENFLANGELTGRIRAFDPNEVIDMSTGEVVGPYPTKYPDRIFEARLVGKLTYPDNTVTRWVALNEDLGIFTFKAEGGNPLFVRCWLLKEKGSYEGESTSSTSHPTTTPGKIYELIVGDKETFTLSGQTVAWGGETRGKQFLRNKLSGSVTCLEPGLGKGANTQHQSFEFKANLVGRIGPMATGINKYYTIASSDEYGVFAYEAAGSPPSGSNYTPANEGGQVAGGTKNYVRHWYSRLKDGPTTDGSNGLFSDGEGTTFGTDNGNPEGNQTVSVVTHFPDYDPNHTYSVGSYVTYNNKIWKCKIATGDPAGAWDSSKWELKDDFSQGQVFVGFDATHDDWKVELNTPVQYEDADGNIHIADGFVSAADFNIPTIPSFKTKLGVFGTVIAGAVQATEISADRSLIKQIFGNEIVADSYIRADKIGSHRMNTDNINISGDAKITLSDGDTASLRNCFSSCIVSEGTGSNAGKIFFEFYKIGGGKAQTVNFNIAATQTYKDAVAAARNAVYAHNVSISAGQTQTFYLKYMDSSGHEQNTGRSFTVTASGGSSSGQPYNAYATRFSTPQYNDNGTLRNMTQVKNSLNTYTPITLTGSSGGDYETRSICFIGADGGHYYIAVDMP